MPQINVMNRLSDNNISSTSSVKPLVEVNEFDKEDEILDKLDVLINEIKNDRTNIQELINQANQRSLGQANANNQQPKTMGFLDNLIPGVNMSSLLWIGIIGFLIYWFFIKDK